MEVPGLKAEEERFVDHFFSQNTQLQTAVKQSAKCFCFVITDEKLGDSARNLPHCKL